MKRALSLLLVATMLLMLCACGGGVSSNATAPAENSSSSLMPDNGDEVPNFSGREIVFGVWGGSFADACLQAYVEPFEKLTGATVTIEEYGPDVTAKVIAQKEQGVKGFDVISGCGVTDQMANMAKRGALLKLDYSKMPNSDYVEAKYDYCVGQYILSILIAWNTDVYGEDPPDTMAKYFDTENYLGNRADCAFGNNGRLEQILLANGESIDSIYPVDTEQAYKLLDECQYRENVAVWWDSASTIRQILADGEVDCGIFWGGSVLEAIMSDGLDNIALSHDYAALVTDGMAITATCRDPELAYAFVDYCLSAEAEAKWSELKYYAPTNPQAYNYIDPEMLPYFTTYGENGKTAFYCDVDYLIENNERDTEQWLLYIGG